MSGARGRGDQPREERGAGPRLRGPALPPHTPEGKLVFSIFLVCGLCNLSNKQIMTSTLLMLYLCVNFVSVFLLISVFVSRLSQRGSTDKLEKTCIMSSQRNSRRMWTRWPCTCSPSFLWSSTVFTGPTTHSSST